MEMIIVFRAKRDGAVERRRVGEFGSGATEGACVSDARTKMEGCDYYSIVFVAAYELPEETDDFPCPGCECLRNPSWLRACCACACA